MKKENIWKKEKKESFRKHGGRDGQLGWRGALGGVAWGSAWLPRGFIYSESYYWKSSVMK